MPSVCGSAAPLASFEVTEHRQNAIDMGVLVVKAVERAGETHRIAGIVALVELLAAGKGRDRGVERKAEEFDACRRVGIGRLEIGRNVG